jgi:hypothetical protein
MGCPTHQHIELMPKGENFGLREGRWSNYFNAHSDNCLRTCPVERIREFSCRNDDFEAVEAMPEAVAVISRHYFAWHRFAALPESKRKPPVDWRARQGARGARARSLVLPRQRTDWKEAGVRRPLQSALAARPCRRAADGDPENKRATRARCSDERKVQNVSSCMGTGPMTGNDAAYGLVSK